MKERPIIFSTEMVRAILDRRKTQTRRVVKPQIHYRGDLGSYMEIRNPYGDPCDRLWVRETWKWEGDTKFTDIDRVGAFYYKADDKENIIAKWKSSRFMPKEAARLFLEITNIRVERLNDISEVDAKQEGVMVRKGHKVKPLWSNEPAKQITHKQMFEGLWDSINDKRGSGWKSNPWVWVIEFKRING